MCGAGTLGLFCMLVAIAPASAQARTARARGTRAVSLPQEQVRWSGHDRGVVDRGKADSLVVDGGDAGWSLDLLSLRSSRVGDTGDDARTWLMLEAREGGAGTGMRHASDGGFILTSMF